MVVVAQRVAETPSAAVAEIPLVPEAAALVAHLSVLAVLRSAPVGRDPVVLRSAARKALAS